MNEVMKHDAGQKSLRASIEAAKPEFQKALPGHIPLEKFVRTVQTAVSMASDLEEACRTPGGLKSLMIACTKAATDGLILDNREAALVTFNSKVSKNPDRWEKRVQYIPMVAGLMKKARNSGDVEIKPPQIVYENDFFEFDPTNDDAPKHRPDWFSERGQPIGVYIVCRLKSSNEPVTEIMTKKQVMAIAAQSKNSKQYNPDEGKNWGEWWRKTVIRRISKYLPSSADSDLFLQAVQRIDEGFSFDDGPTRNKLTIQQDLEARRQKAETGEGFDTARIESDLDSATEPQEDVMDVEPEEEKPEPAEEPQELSDGQQDLLDEIETALKGCRTVPDLDTEVSKFNEDVEAGGQALIDAAQKLYYSRKAELEQ